MTKATQTNTVTAPHNETIAEAKAKLVAAKLAAKQAKDAAAEARKVAREAAKAEKLAAKANKPKREKAVPLTVEQRHALQARAKAELLPDYKYRMVLSGRDIDLLLKALDGVKATPGLEDAITRLVKRGYR